VNLFVINYDLAKLAMSKEKEKKKGSNGSHPSPPAPASVPFLLGFIRIFIFV